MTILQIQTAINQLGYTPPLVEDGDLGIDTQAGIQWLQAQLAQALATTKAPITSAAYLPGIDIYHGDANGSFDLSQQKFVYLKASQGTTEVDPAFAARRAQCKSLGIPCGAYHYLDPAADGATQAQHFASVIGSLESGDLPPALDFEDDSADTSTLTQRALNFLTELTKLLGATPVVYTYPSFRTTYCQNIAFAQYPLWYSDLVPNLPTDVAPWSKVTFWQYSTSSLDLDYFNGTSAELQALLRT